MSSALLECILKFYFFSSKVLKLQQKVNEYQTRTEDLQDEKKILALRVKELEEEISNRPAAGANQRAVDELRSKLLAAETLCEELMDENEDMKRELRDMEEEMEEMQDSFRSDNIFGLHSFHQVNEMSVLDIIFCFPGKIRLMSTHHLKKNLSRLLKIVEFFLLNYGSLRENWNLLKMKSRILKRNFMK